MKAQLITSLGEITPDGSPLKLKEIPRPRPATGQARLKIIACGVCHTELDEIEGPTTARAPEPCQAIIDTTPAWLPVCEALANLTPGGRLVINAIRKEAGDKDALQDLDYARHLWLEKEIKSVANVTRQDIQGMLHAASKIDLQPTLTEYSLEEANQALKDIKFSRGRGAKVLKISI